MAAFYRATIAEFLSVDPAKPMLDLTSGVAGMGFDLKADQHSAWLEQARILHTALKTLAQQNTAVVGWGLLLEYQIPGRAKRLDAVLLDGAGIIAIEFKIGAVEFLSADKWQLLEYCWNLRDFHHESEGVAIVPMLVATAAPVPEQHARSNAQQRLVLPMQFANAQTLATSLHTAHERLIARGRRPLVLEQWDASQARPTRTVIDEAQRLFQAHDSREISHAHADNTTDALNEIIKIVRESREQGKAYHLLLTGVPGAGKTLVGLHAAYSPAMIDAAAGLTTFASGNQPLIDVLNLALTLNRTRVKKEKREIGHSLSAPIENVHRFVMNHLLDPAGRPPPQAVVIFDEAQRVWTADKVKAGLSKRVMRNKLTEQEVATILANGRSEPELLLRVMERCPDWCVVVALIGGGQEIHNGEAGLAEWGRTLTTANGRWTVSVSNEALEGGASVAGQTLFPSGIPAALDVRVAPVLHLVVAKRSLRAERYAEWVNNVLSWQPQRASPLMPELAAFPIFLTRDLRHARTLLRDYAGGDNRYGLLASSGASRMRADGIELKREFRDSLKYPEWFLRPMGDIRSSNQLEIAATEFECQGLELDWTCLCWGGDLLPDESGQHWRFWKMHGHTWRPEKDVTQQQFILNKYRVLLTRARFGTVIFVPRGDVVDVTRQPAPFDALANYLTRCGLRFES